MPPKKNNARKKRKSSSAASGAEGSAPSSPAASPQVAKKGGKKGKGGAAKGDAGASKENIVSGFNAGVSVGDVIDLFGDGKLTKKIIALPSDAAAPLPPAGSTVFVHYHGTLASDGSVFDSSVDRNQEFSFELGASKVIKGWDIGVATMRLGEKSLLTCSPEYAYGEQSPSPAIPANSTLNFEVELLRFEDRQDVSEGAGTLLKKTLTEGEGWEMPRDGATVTVAYTLTEGSSKEGGAEVQSEAEVTWVVGDAEVPSVLDKVVKEMKPKERTVFDVAAAAFPFVFADPSAKLASTLRAPKAASGWYSVTLELTTLVKAKDAWEQTEEEKVAEADAAKARGNEFFKKGLYDLALGKYDAVAKTLAQAAQFEDAGLKEKALALTATAASNSAQVHLKRENWSEALVSAKKCVEADSSNVKGHFRMGMAQVSLVEWDAARASFTRAIKLDPKNVEARRQLEKLRQKVKAHDAKERKKFQGMFAKFSAEESAERAASVHGATGGAAASAKKPSAVDSEPVKMEVDPPATVTKADREAAVAAGKGESFYQ
jgi:FKBP-type peptidyl-prolyl cis-trans isomerase/tetratricopeptide (TPR) repeat protein